MDIKKITRRLDAIQQSADRSRPCRMTVVFTDGHQTVTDPEDAISLFREHGPLGVIDRFEADRPEYSAMAAIWTILCHPAANREVEDFESSN